MGGCVAFPPASACSTRQRPFPAFSFPLRLTQLESRPPRTSRPPLFWTPRLEPGAVASIERKAYPRFKAALSAQEPQTLYAPTEEERAFVATHARTDTQRLTLLTLLKCHQSLGYLPAFETIPPYIRQYLCHQLSLAAETEWHTEKHLRSRYRHLI